MTAQCPFCDKQPPDTPPPRQSGAERPRWLRLAIGAVRWIAPGALLAVMPKCPMCLAGYVALWTGLGLSIPAAARIRWLLIIVCVASLACLAAFQARRLFMFTRRSSIDDHLA